jgi:hypothetical protein
MIAASVVVPTAQQVPAQEGASRTWPPLARPKRAGLGIQIDAPYTSLMFGDLPTRQLHLSEQAPHRE